LDGDGKPDLIVANPGDGTISILQNISEGGVINFPPKVDIATGAGCCAVAVGDVNGDGKPDIVAANTDGMLLVLQNVINAPGTITTNSFEPKISLPVPSGAVDVAIVDIDGDGKPDLTVTSYLPQLFSIIQNLSNSGELSANSFGQRIDYPLGGRGHTISVGDLEGNGKPDLVVDTELKSTISIFHNQSTPGILTNVRCPARLNWPPVGMPGALPSAIWLATVDPTSSLPIPTTTIFPFTKTWRHSARWLRPLRPSQYLRWQLKAAPPASLSPLLVPGRSAINGDLTTKTFPARRMARSF